MCNNKRILVKMMFVITSIVEKGCICLLNIIDFFETDIKKRTPLAELCPKDSHKVTHYLIMLFFIHH